MKYMRYLFVLAIAVFAMASVSHAQTIQFLGGGSSALYVELGQAAANLVGSTAMTPTGCLWTQGKASTVVARDNRTASPTDEQGNIWIAWTMGTGTCAVPAGSWSIYSYMQLDSTVGDKCYFEVDSSGTPGCVQVITITAGTAGANKLGTGFTDTAGGIPAPVITALNGQHFFVAGTDILPVDAKYAVFRDLTPCGTAIYRQAFDQQLRQSYGLGYQTTTTGVGTDIISSFDTSLFHVLDFNISGNDPITTPAQAVPAFTVSTVGIQPIVVAVGPATGTGASTGIAAATDIPMYVLMNFYNGTLGRNTDLLGPSVLAPVTSLVRESLSGTYNTFEWSAINNSQFHDSQDGYNCNSSTPSGVFANPMTLQSANGQTIAGGAAWRKRVIGTGQMTTQLQAATVTDQRLGYFFWSLGNVTSPSGGGPLTNVKYLTVNGVDPLTNGYTDGVLPGTDAAHPVSAVTFKYLNAGDYPIWSALRLVSKSPTPAVVTSLIAAVQTLSSTQNDLVTLANAKIWHSHYYLPAINQGVAANGTTINPATPNDLCNSAGALAEFGGDAGAATILKQANADFCTDFGNITGLINKTN